MNIRVIAVIAWFIGVFFSTFHRRFKAQEKMGSCDPRWPSDPKTSWGVLYITRWKLTYCKPSWL